MEHAVSDLMRMRVVSQLMVGWMKHAGYMSLQTIHRTRRTGTNCFGWYSSTCSLIVKGDSFC